MKNFENEFSGVQLDAYRAGVELTQEGITKLESLFIHDGLDPSWCCPGSAGREGRTLLSRIVQTVVSRNWTEMKEEEASCALSAFASVFSIFMKKGFQSGERNGLSGTRVLGALLEWERPDYADRFIRDFLKAGADPTLPVFPALLDHRASPLDIAEGNLARSYEDGGDLSRMVYDFVIYRMLLAARDGRDCSQIRPLEEMKEVVLQDAAFLSVQSQDRFCSSAKRGSLSHAEFCGLIRLRFDQGDVYVNPWGGAVTDSFVTMPGAKKEERLNDFFGECIGQCIKNTHRALSASSHRCLYIEFENEYEETFLSDAFNPFADRTQGDIFIYPSEDDREDDYDDEDEDDYYDEDEDDYDEGDYGEGSEEDGAPRETGDLHTGEVS